MARSPRPISLTDPYHITARCINREWFRIPMLEVWNIFSRHLFFLHHGHEVLIHSFVLMQNHFHLIISTPKGNISQAMLYFMTNTSRDITMYSGRTNQTYGGPYFSSLIPSYHYFLHAYKYVYRNPVEAGLCRRVEDYAFSSLNGLLGNSHLLFPLIGDEILLGDIEDTLSWLNRQPDEIRKTQIRRALRRTFFTLPRNPKNSGVNALECEKY